MKFSTVLLLLAWFVFGLFALDSYASESGLTPEQTKLLKNGCSYITLLGDCAHIVT
jgi:hypothetical protein